MPHLVERLCGDLPSGACAAIHGVSAGAAASTRFWRTFGIILLAGIAVGFVTAAISVPFSIAGSVITLGSAPHAPTIGGTMVATIGQAIGQVIVTPFLAGVTTLLYVDARIRSEAFDFTLMAPGSADADSVWLGR